MTHLAVIDLDNVADIDRLWHELERAHELRTADPELRDNIEKAITAALDRGAITEEQATEIDLMLESCVPSRVLEAWRKELIPNLDRRPLVRSLVGRSVLRRTSTSGFGMTHRALLDSSRKWAGSPMT